MKSKRVELTDQQLARFSQIMDALDSEYGPGDTYEDVTYDYELTGREGTKKTLRKFETSRRIVRKEDTARYFAENNGYSEKCVGIIQDDQLVYRNKRYGKV